MTRLVLVALLLGPSVGMAAAQESDAAAPGESPDSSARPLALPPLVVTAGKMPLRAERVGFSLSTVSGAELERERVVYAADALRRVPGAFVDEATGPGGPAIVRLRGGEEVFTQLLIDGVQLNENGGFLDLQGLALANVERVEVAAGPQSALYGSSAVSGVVQILSRRGQPGPPRLSAALEGGGSAAESRVHRATASVAGGTRLFRYSAGAGTAYDRGVFALPHDLRTYDAAANFDAFPSARWRLSGDLRVITVESMLPVRDPGATRVALDPNARNERDRALGSVTAEFRPSDRWRHQLRASSYRQDFLYEDRHDGVPQPADYFVFDFNLDYLSDLQRQGIEYVAGYVSERDSGDRGYAFSLGGQLEREALDSRTSGDFEDAQTLRRDSRALFAEAHATPLSGVHLLAGGRLEAYEELDAEFTPRASVVVDAIPGVLALRAAGGRAYKAPNLQQVDNPFLAPNPDLKAESSTSWEAGANLRLYGGRVGAGATLFRQEFRNLIRTVPLEGSDRQINRNLGESRATGVEWWGRIQLRPQARLGLQGAWTETEILENTGLSPDQFPLRGELPFRPELVAAAFLELSPIDRLEAVVRATRVGSQFVLTERFSGRRAEVDPYHRVDAAVNFAWTPGLTLYLRVDNLLDAQYETAYDRPGLPMRAVIGFQLDG